MIYVGCDHGGFELKEALVAYLKSKKKHVVDCGNKVYDPTDNFPTFVLPVMKGVRCNPQNYGLLICGTGMGMCIAANHYSGMRAVVAHNVEYARLAREHNNANVLCLGGRYLTLDEAKAIVDVFFSTRPDPEPKYYQRMVQACRGHW